MRIECKEDWRILMILGFGMVGLHSWVLGRWKHGGRLGLDSYRMYLMSESFYRINAHSDKFIDFRLCEYSA